MKEPTELEERERQRLGSQVEELFHRKAKEDGDREHLRLLAEDLNQGILLGEALPLGPEDVLKRGALTSRVQESLASLRVVLNHQRELDRFEKERNPRDPESVALYQERIYSLLGRESLKGD